MRVVARGCSQLMENPLVWEPPLMLKRIEKFFFFFPPFFSSCSLLVLLNFFPDLSVSSLCFEFSCSIHQKLFLWEHGNVEI